MPSYPKPVEPRFQKFLPKNKKPDECWVWQGSRRRDGYGQLSVNAKPAAAHRVAYELYVGPIPKGLEIDHLCNNGRGGCVNPKHLEPVTHAENGLRRYQRDPITKCRRGHLFTDENTYVDPKGSRNCRICLRASWQRKRERKNK